MAKLQALIFDVDGTLAETERDGHRVAFNRAFAQAGLDWDWSETLYGELLEIAGGKERIQFFVEQYNPHGSLPTNLDHFAAYLHAAKSRFYQELLQENAIPLRPGVRRLLTEALNSGVRLAIATTSTLPNAMALLEHALAPDSRSWFDVIAAGNIVPAKKPAPDIYQFVLDKMGLTPKDCLVIEDSHQGLTAATRAELPVVVTANGYTRQEDLSTATLVVDHLGEPENPFTVLAGDAAGASYLDLALAEDLQSRTCPIGG